MSEANFGSTFAFAEFGQRFRSQVPGTDPRSSNEGFVERATSEVNGVGLFWLTLLRTSNALVP